MVPAQPGFEVQAVTLKAAFALRDVACKPSLLLSRLCFQRHRRLRPAAWTARKVDLGRLLFHAGGGDYFSARICPEV